MPGELIPQPEKRRSGGAQPGAGRPAFAITPQVLKEVKRLGASGIAGRWAAAALGIHYDTFHLKKTENPEFSKAWDDGRKLFARKIAAAAPKIMDKLIKAAEGGNVTAQSVFIEKVQGRPNAPEENGNIVSLDELGQGPEQDGRAEIQDRKSVV